MNKIDSLFKNNKPFFFGFLLLILFAVFVCIYFTKADGFYLLNPYHTKLLDTIFYYFTFLGDGFFCIGVGILFLFFKRKIISILILSSYILSGILAQVLKYFIIEARPAVFLKDAHYAFFIDKVTLHNYHSFPSGHTASAFALATVLAFAFRNKLTGLALLALAAGVGYSRMYLGQHFLIDVLSGALIGFVSAILCSLIWYKKFL